MKDRIKIGELPELRILQLNRILLHEYPDRRRAASLLKSMKSLGILKNPPVVGIIRPLNENIYSRTENGGELINPFISENGIEFILLDGTNRISALRELGCRDALVQIIDFYDEKLIISKWSHTLEKFEKDRLLHQLFKIKGVEIKENENSKASRTCEGNTALCRITFRDESQCIILSESELLARTSALKSITGLYINNPWMDRVSYTNLNYLKINYPSFSALLSFQGFEKNEILFMARNGIKIPGGVTRVVLPKRALLFNISLKFLMEEIPINEKNSILQTMISEKIKNKSIRFYQEPTFHFDE
ncbi:MAG: hypothetical protein ACE5QV_00925 [Fidelibacterota bacterium]